MRLVVLHPRWADLTLLASHMTQRKSPYKSTGGPARLASALNYSTRGLLAAFRHEAAFRQELLATAILIPLAFWIGRNTGEVLVLIAPLFFVLVVEMLNSAVEAISDAVTLEHHVLIGRAKDLGSAAVMLSIILAVIVWGAVIASHVLR